MNYLNNIFKQSIQVISGGTTSLSSASSSASSLSTTTTTTLSNDSISKANLTTYNDNNSNSHTTSIIDPATHLFQLYKEVCAIIDSEANSFTSKIIDTEAKLYNSKLRQNLMSIYILLQTENKKLYKLNTSNLYNNSTTSTASSSSSTTTTSIDIDNDNVESNSFNINKSNSDTNSDSSSFSFMTATIVTNRNDVTDDVPSTPCLDMFLNLKVVQHLCSRAVTDAPRGD